MKVTVNPDDLKMVLLHIQTATLPDNTLHAYGRLWGAATRVAKGGKKKAQQGPVKYRLVCIDRPNDKITVIRCMRGLFRWGLKEAKDIVDAGGAFDMPTGYSADNCRKIALIEHGCALNEV